MLKLIQFMLLALLLNSAFAKDCRIDQEDPFEPNAVITSGKFKGECLDTSKIRSYQQLFRDNTPDGDFIRYLLGDNVVIANVLHQNKFYLAVINPKAISNIYFQVEKFAPEWLAAHTQIRFQFDKRHPVLLLDQKFPLIPEAMVQDLVLSVEAVFLNDGPKYDLWKGLHGYYGLAHRLVTLEQRYDEAIRDQGHTVNQYLLNPNKELVLGQEKSWKGEFFHVLIEEMHHPKMDGVYHTLKVNCTNELFKGMDKFFEIKGKPGKGLGATWPVFAPGALKRRGYIESKKPGVSLNDEFEKR